MKNKINIFRNGTLLLFSVVAMFYITGCVEDFKLPEAGSKADTTPPKANFSFASDPADFKTIKFTNLSAEATIFLWDFGGGKTSTDQHPSFTFAAEATYPVTLTSTDALGAVHSITQKVLVKKGPYQPVVLEPGFEDGKLAGAMGDGRDSWKNSALGGVIQITSSPVVSGTQGAKLTGSPTDQRVGYQEIVVAQDSDYKVNFIYTMLTTPAGYVTVDIVDASGGTITSHADAQSLVLGSVTVNNQEDDKTYESGSVSFNSGTSEKIAIYFYNGGSVESRVDDFSIDIASAGAIPPSAAFLPEQSTTNYLEYTFTNSSVNATSYEWDFGDGNTSTDKSPTHVYTEAKMYTVKLIAKSSGTGLSADFTAIVDIQDEVTADFTAVVDGADKMKYMFTSTASANTTSVAWDFGDGWSASLESLTHTYDKPGSYSVSLTATSVTGFTHTKTMVLAVAVPEVLNGNFDASSSNWKIAAFTGGNTNPFNGSSDGSPINYDGSDNGSKTKGAKWTSSTSGGSLASPNSRYAYQAMDLEPNTNYILEYAYAIKDDAATDPAGGRRVIAEILDGHFDDGATALTATRLVTSEGKLVLGKGNFTVVQVSFTSNANGKVAIWLWAITPKDAFMDNIKILFGN